MPPDRRLKILTWQVHGNYLWYLSQIPHDFYLVTKPGHPAGYAGRTASFPWGSNVFEVSPAQVRELQIDCVLYQSRQHWDEDRMTLLTSMQRQLPSLCVEHDPPREHPSDTRHWAQGVDMLVQVTAFNALMWDSHDIPTKVIEHGVLVPPDVRWHGERAVGLVVVNHLERRGRRLGADLYLEARRRIPLELAGMESSSMPGGIGEIANVELAATMAAYRFFFNPIRWTSLGLALIEAMMIGMPVVALATTELPTVIRNDDNGWIDTSPDALIAVMRRLCDDPDTARRWGARARETAEARFGIGRFIDDWNAVLQRLVP